VAGDQGDKGRRGAGCKRGCLVLQL
jgi:hypothetical protein